MPIKYFQSSEDMKAVSWCFENNYKVDIIPQSKKRKPLVKLNIKKDNKIIKRGKKLYPQDKELYLIISQIYLYLYRRFK